MKQIKPAPSIPSKIKGKELILKSQNIQKIKQYEFDHFLDQVNKPKRIDKFSEQIPPLPCQFKQKQVKEIITLPEFIQMENPPPFGGAQAVNDKDDKIFDSSVLLGELIKTEYLINSDSLKYINQTEIISQFFNYTDQLLPIINDIIDEVMENDIFNTSTQNIIMTALQGNLCENFPKFYYFCNISSDLTYSEKDITYMYLTQGISGMMQKYQNLLQSEFSYERDSLQYETDITLLQEYLDSQTHQNIFVQYFYDMEYLVYTSFNYFYEQTMTIGQEVKDKLSNFFLYSGLISLAIISVEFLIWYYIEDQEFSQLKLIITLLPQSLLKNKNINRLVVRTFTQIY
ncbi:unnamed protein product [Paramecium sonneborni]|uniref:Transmembrane protein n=1 Tax=Paramecium sonneborni TaxID=65129 RepID=A0A8S1R3G9_9CILI|nr:unnamed protein product [Paramecium sonneborni]